LSSQDLLIPPAPRVYDKPLNSLHMAWLMSRSTISAWTSHAYEMNWIRGQVLGTDNLTVFDPAGVQDILKLHRSEFIRPAVMSRPIRPLVGEGLILAEGETWRRQRHSLAPLFNPAAVGGLIPHFQAAGDSLVQQLWTQDSANLSEAFTKAALDAVLRALFSLPDDPRRDAMTRLIRHFVAGPGRPNVLDALSNDESQFGFAAGGRRKARQVWFSLVDSIIADRQSRPSASADEDMLGLMMAARDESGQPLSSIEIRDQSATMLVAGFETTARLLFWAIYLLALDPDEQKRLQQEIDSCPPDRMATMQDLAAWPRLRSVLLEALRLYPPVSLILRQPINAVTVLGQELTPRTRVWISPWVIHRHKKHWTNPTAFDPARFDGKPQAFLTNDAFLPFGGGPRVCIGASFALTEAAILLASLLKSFRISLPSDCRPVMPISSVTIGPDHEPQFLLERR